MKIIIDATSTQDQFMNRGPGRYAEEVISKMIRQSVKEGRNDTFYLLLFNAPTKIQPVITECCDNVKSINIGKKRLSDKFNDIWWNLQYKPAIRKLIKEEKPDLYFCPYFWRNFPTKGIPTVVMIHDLTFPLQGKYSMAPKYLDWIRKWQYHKTLNKLTKVDAVLTNSNNTTEDLLKFVNLDTEKIRTIHLGISEWVKKVRPRKKILREYLTDEVIDQGYIFYDSGANPSKNITGMIRSYGEILKLYEKNENDKWPYMVIAGKSYTNEVANNPYLKQIADVIEELGLQDKVHFTGYFEDEHLSDLYGGGSLVMNLSFFEGFGFSALQTMRAGLPLIASNTSCYPEVLGNGAILMDPNNHSKIGKEAYELLNNKRKLNALGRKGLEWSKKYTWKNTAKETYEFLQEIVNKSKNG